MHYNLYYADRSAAMGPRVILDEIGAPYNLIWTDIEAGSTRAPEFLSLNPNGWIPVLISQEGAIYECGAITVFLCDRHPEAGLAPALDEPERGPFLQWLFFFSSSLQNAYQMTYYTDRFCSSEVDHPSVKVRSISRLRELWSVVDDAIGDSGWLLGKRFSAADIYLFMLTTWLNETHGHPPLNSFPNVARVAAKVMERTSVGEVYASYIADRKSSEGREPSPTR